MANVTLRLPPELHAEATAYAAAIGVSLNALGAVALRDYLDARKRAPAAAPAVAEAEAEAEAGAAAAGVAAPAGRPAAAGPARRAPAPAPARTAAPKVAEVPKVGANQPCPCGSGKKYKRCHGAGP